MRIALGTHRLLFLALLAATGTAKAAASGPDTSTVPPNVMLLVDTSGSMELTTDGKEPTCDPTNPNTGSVADTNQKSRWITLMEVLTGTIDKYSCFAEKRSSNDFKNEFSLGPTLLPPIDYLYHTFAYHRPLSNQCAPGAGDLPTTAPWAWPSGALSPIKYRQFAGGTISPTAYCAPGTWVQSADGVLDAYRGLLRFGLMTFDTEADAGTGTTNPNTTYGIVDGTENLKNGIHGAWSYYLPSGVGCRQKSPVSSSTQCTSLYADGTSDPNTGGCCMGGPINCTALSPWEVGARNAAAPPWEGRMVAFGPSGEDGVTRIGWIKDILRATRPYSATPIAGMLNDARDFFWNDETRDPLNKPNEYFGPSKDPETDAGCRQTFAVLLTDGEPNEDLRTECEGLPADKCPYDRAEDIARDLANPVGPRSPVRTFVVGFALDTVKVNGVDIDCKTLSPTDPLCTNPTDSSLKACCRLNNIAFNGTPTALQASADPSVIKYAQFAKTAGDLRTVMNTILGAATQSSAITRTYPLSILAPLSDKTPSNAGNQRVVGYEMTSGYESTQWRGILNRTRLVCDPNTQIAQEETLNRTLGDDFVENVKTDNPDGRTMFTVEPPGSATGWDPEVSIRPFFTDTLLDDGLSLVGGVQSAFVNPGALKSVITPTALKATAASCTPAAASASLCRDQIVNYMSGLTTASPVSRCPTTAKCNVIGDVFHSTPAFQPGIPSDFLRDTSYTAFATSQATRDGMIYVSTNDGFFHGFWLYPGDGDATRVVDHRLRNESWAFVPPAAIPSFVTQYPTQIVEEQPPLNRSPELDGQPIIRDVEATQGGPRALNTTASSPSYYPYVLERKRQPESNETHTWRTVMAQAFGPRRGGYFAVDVTSPKVQPGNNAVGPKFLWQLTKDAAGHDVFGHPDPAPLITTLLVDLSQLGVSSGETTREVPVAVLAGGMGDTRDPACTAQPGTNLDIDSTGAPAGAPTAYRTSIACYNTPLSVAARSVTIVRLDNGQILRTFRPANLPSGVTSPVTFDSKVLTTQDIPAPMTGQPAAYPAGTGQVADRIFLGDAEGRLWRLDVADANPANWTLRVFFDAYYDEGSHVPQPVQLQPVLGVDEKGQITVAYATGNQDNLSLVDGQYDYVVSLTETLVGSAGVNLFKSRLNWRHRLTNGEHVLGPMALFDRYLYLTTYAPVGARGESAPRGVCRFGDAYIFAEHYTKGDSVSPLLVGGIPTDPLATTNQTLKIDSSVVPGTTIRQKPSCAPGITNQASSDDFLGYGKTTTVTSVTPGGFEVFVQKSGNVGTGVSVPPPIATQTAAILTPRIPVRIDSWAPVTE
ncbi:MAG TPA: hypothetical protein VHE30_08400 [Polyangiaceae bacterium]|nr:hypothetical protein [Polyangiaceae bacterium]